MQHPGRTGRLRWTIGVATASTSDHYSENTTGIIRDQGLCFLVKLILAWAIKPEPPTTLLQAPDMSIPKRHVSIDDGDGLEQTVTVKQAAVRRLERGPVTAIDEKHRWRSVGESPESECSVGAAETERI